MPFRCLILEQAVTYVAALGLPKISEPKSDVTEVDVMLHG
jgi:hypothetical protein